MARHQALWEPTSDYILEMQTLATWQLEPYRQAVHAYAVQILRSSPMRRALFGPSPPRTDDMRQMLDDFGAEPGQIPHERRFAIWK